MQTVIERFGATRVGLGVALLFGATLMSPVESYGAGASANNICPTIVPQNCAVDADCGAAVSAKGVGVVTCDAGTHKCTVQCATTFANTDVTAAVVDVVVDEDACVGPSSGSSIFGPGSFHCFSNTSGGPGGPDPTVANTLACFATLEPSGCVGGQCTPVPPAVSSPNGAQSVTTASLAASDSSVGGPDTQVCTVQEVINYPASACAIPTSGVCTTGTCTAGRVGPPAATCARNSDCNVANVITDNMGLVGTVEGTTGTSNAIGPQTIVVNCCGDGTVNQITETCDTNPQNSIPDTPAECGNANVTPAVTCNTAATVNKCRAPTDANAPCTICGDGIVQLTATDPVEQCDGTALRDATKPILGGATCRTDCTYCGDGIKNDDEFCDPAAGNNDPINNPAGAFCLDTCSTTTTTSTSTSTSSSSTSTSSSSSSTSTSSSSSSTSTSSSTSSTSTSTSSTTTTVIAACRVTGGGLVDACGTISGEPPCDPSLSACAPACGDTSFDALNATHGGQVGAPIGVANDGQNPLDPGQPCIKGEWTHVRHIRPRLNGNFHARTFDSLECFCLACQHCAGDATKVCSSDSDCGADAPCNEPGFGSVVGAQCNPDDRICGPEPRRAPDNKICFSGVGNYALTNGKRAKRKVVFRVDIEDRGEPGGTNGPPPPDRYRMRIWLVDSTGSHGDLGNPDSQNSLAFQLRKDVACGFPKLNGALTGGEDPLNTALTPDIDDGGDLFRGNHQIHPSLKKTCP